MYIVPHTGYPSSQAPLSKVLSHSLGEEVGNANLFGNLIREHGREKLGLCSDWPPGWEWPLNEGHRRIPLLLLTTVGYQQEGPQTNLHTLQMEATTTINQQV